MTENGDRGWPHFFRQFDKDFSVGKWRPLVSEDDYFPDDLTKFSQINKWPLPVSIGVITLVLLKAEISNKADAVPSGHAVANS